MLLICFFPSCIIAQVKPSSKAARSLHKEGKYAEAIIMLDALIKSEPSDATLFNLRGQCNFKNKEWTKAADDFKRAVDLRPKEKENYEFLAESYFHMKDFGHAMESYQNLLNKFLLVYDFAHERIGYCKVMLGDYDGALSWASSSLNDFPENECFLFIRAMAYDSLGSYQLAVIGYEACLKQFEKRKKEATLHNLSSEPAVWYALARANVQMYQFEQAASALKKALQLLPEDIPANLLGGKIYLELNDPETALAMIEKVVEKNPGNETALLSRANAFFRTGRYAAAIKDYSNLLEKRDTTVSWYLDRASCYEAIAEYPKALADFTKAGALAPKRTKDLVLGNRKRVMNKMFLANKEEVPPVIIVKSPDVLDGNSLSLPKSLVYARISGVVEDQSLLKSISVNAIEADFFSDSLHPHFEVTIPVRDRDSALVRAVDIYNNVSTKVYSFNRIEQNKPQIQLFVPMDPLATQIIMDARLNMVLNIEGRINDESFIKSIRVNGVEASFATMELNPVFSLNWKVHRTDSLIITVEDEFGNQLRKAYYIDTKTARQNQLNPMGTTWVVFIENAHYRDMESLEGPTRDVEKMVQALNAYQISNKLVKKDLSYAQMDKFFRIELRDLVKQNKVNSLLIWFAGHGRYLNEAGYWIPVDAGRNDEAAFFPVANLASYLKTYGTYLKHILVVSDACEGGKSFYTRTNAFQKNEPCKVGLQELAASSEVFSSTSNERASDQSVFASSFSSALNGCEAPCISISEIVKLVTPAVEKNQQQFPRFGQISYLPNLGGTFTFIRQTH